MRRGLRSWVSADTRNAVSTLAATTCSAHVLAARCASPRAKRAGAGQHRPDGRLRAAMPLESIGSSASQSPTAGRSAALAAARLKRRWKTTSTMPSAVAARITPPVLTTRPGTRPSAACSANAASRSGVQPNAASVRGRGAGSARAVGMARSTPVTRPA